MAEEQLGIAVPWTETQQRHEIFRDVRCSGGSVGRGRAGGARGTHAGMELLVDGKWGLLEDDTLFSGSLPASSLGWAVGGLG